jgi:hypothetical protein
VYWSASSASFGGSAFTLTFQEVTTIVSQVYEQASKSGGRRVCAVR